METTPRKSMSKQRQLRIFEARKGICFTCREPIDGVRQKWFIEHERALGLGGEDTDANCWPAHYECKPEKDKADIAAIAEAKRRKAKHIGIRPVAKLKTRPGPISERTAKNQANPKQSLQPRALFQPITPDIDSGKAIVARVRG